MRLTPAIVTAALLMTSCTVSKRMSVFVRPETTTDPGETIDLTAYEEKYGEYDGVYLLVENTMEHYGTKEAGYYHGIGASWNYVRIWRQKYIVFNPEVDYLTSFRASMPDKVYMIVTTPDGQVRRYGKDDLKKEKVTEDYDRYTLIYPDIVKGTIIEEAWENVFPGRFFALYDVDIPLQYPIPCEKMTVSYAYPEWWSVAIKDIGPDRPAAAEWSYDPDSKKSILKCAVENVPALVDEPYSPFFKEMAEYLQFHVTKLEMKGAIYDRPINWPELAKDFNKYALKKAGKNQLAVRAAVNQILPAGATDYERAVAIVTHIQDNFDVVDDNLDGNCGKMLKEQRGDASDLTVLAQAMLTEAGLETAYLLVHSAAQGYFDPKFYSMEQFQAPAVRVRLNSLDYTVFPYMRHVPVDHTPRFFQGQKALMMKDDITSLWTLPEGNRADNAMAQDYHLRIAENGAITIQEKRTAAGYNGYWMREAIEMLDEDETDDFMQDLLTFSGGDITVDSFVVHNAEAANQPLEIDLYYTIANLVTVMEDEVIFQTGGLFSPLSQPDSETDPSERKNPIQVDFDQQFDKTITIIYPRTWTLAAELANVSLENEFGSIRGEYVVSDSSLTVTQRVLLNRTRADKSRYGILLELIGSETPLSIPALVFSVETIPEPVSGATPPVNK